ncbi:MAG: protein kinase [Deltaproteobacteria bacterium]|nr:protein kinase [Deltaproteobacteria bacterium]
MSKSLADLLIVDDDETNRHLLCTYLRKSGYDVTGVANGPAALAALDNGTFHLVLLDMMMPDMTGMETLRRIRERAHLKTLPVVMATARTDTSDVVDALQAGATDYLTKPFRLPMLIESIERRLKEERESVRERVEVSEDTDDSTTSTEQNPKGPLEPYIHEVRPGVTLAGKYKLEAQIGVGNYGSVYRGQHVDLEQTVAIKVLQIPFQDERALQQFRQEGVSACRVQHPNNVDIRDFGVSSTGVAYLVMEYLEGEDLGDLLEREGTLSILRCSEILLPICFVLAEAHARGIIHRDIKPENIFLAKRKGQKVIKVLDFGIAKFVGEESSVNAQTHDKLLGTPAYMAPERVQGLPYDGRTDVYALGIMLYEMLSGVQPFTRGDPISTAVAHVQEEVPTLDKLPLDVPPQVARVVEQAMSKNPAARPTVELFAVALSQVAKA